MRQEETGNRPVATPVRKDPDGTPTPATPAPVFAPMIDVANKFFQCSFSFICTGENELDTVYIYLYVYIFINLFIYIYQKFFSLVSHSAPSQAGPTSTAPGGGPRKRKPLTRQEPGRNGQEITDPGWYVSMWIIMVAVFPQEWSVSLYLFKNQQIPMLGHGSYTVLNDPCIYVSKCTRGVARCQQNLLSNSERWLRWMYMYAYHGIKVYNNLLSHIASIYHIVIKLLLTFNEHVYKCRNMTRNLEGMNSKLRLCKNKSYMATRAFVLFTYMFDHVWTLEECRTSISFFCSQHIYI